MYLHVTANTAKIGTNTDFGDKYWCAYYQFSISTKNSANFRQQIINYIIAPSNRNPHI